MPSRRWRSSLAGLDAATASPGPRFFHFVTGGVTPAALGADWLTTALDQNAFSWVGSPLGTRLETVSLAWLQELFGLPADWGGALTTGATVRQLHGARRRPAVVGRAARPRHRRRRAWPASRPCRSSRSGFIHPSALKALAMLGIGRATVQTYSRDAAGRLDLDGAGARRSATSAARRRSSSATPAR